MTKRHKKSLARIILSATLFIVVSLIKADVFLKLLLFMLPYLLVGYDVLYSAVKNIFRGQMFDEKFLMSIATIGALILGEYAEAVFVMIFFQVGDLFEAVAVGKSRKSIADLMDLNPDTANVEREGKVIEISPEEIEVGEILLVKPGEKISIDGIVTEGHSSLDTSALTGESLPKDVSEGDNVFSGCININGVLRIRTTKSFESSTASKIIELVENSALSKAKTESFITRFSRYYTPAVVVCAIMLATIPSIITGDFSLWLGRALIFLVVSCPCALVISVPLSFFGGIGASSRQGILVKGSSYLENLAKVKTVVFDKTGTVTKGNFVVKSINPTVISKEDLLKYGASAEKYSNHPIAKAICSAYNGETSAESVEELSGFGVKAFAEGKLLYAGNKKLMSTIDIDADELSSTAIHIAIDGKYAGFIEVEDEVKDDSYYTVQSLKNAGIRTVMLTGDKISVAKKVAENLQIDDYHGGLMPADKVSRIEEYINFKNKVAFMGDGINDAPVLARADVGIAMGGLGSDAAIESADIVIMDDKPSKIITAIKIATKTQQIVYQNVIFALVIKFGVMLLSTLGYANMWSAVFADVGVSVIAILNAMRALHL